MTRTSPLFCASRLFWSDSTHLGPVWVTPSEEDGRTELPATAGQGPLPARPVSSKAPVPLLMRQAEPRGQRVAPGNSAPQSVNSGPFHPPLAGAPTLQQARWAPPSLQIPSQGRPHMGQPRRCFFLKQPRRASPTQSLEAPLDTARCHPHVHPGSPLAEVCSVSLLCWEFQLLGGHLLQDRPLWAPGWARAALDASACPSMPLALAPSWGPGVARRPSSCDSRRAPLCLPTTLPVGFTELTWPPRGALPGAQASMNSRPPTHPSRHFAAVRAPSTFSSFLEPLAPLPHSCSCV